MILKQVIALFQHVKVKHSVYDNILLYYSQQKQRVIVETFIFLTVASKSEFSIFCCTHTQYFALFMTL